MTKRDSIIGALKAIAEQNDGILYPEIVVDAARNPDSPMHDRFTWSDTVAAASWRLHEARQLLRIHWGELQLGDTRIEVPLYISSHPADGNVGYVESTKLAGPAILALAQRDLIAWAKRYRHLLLLHGVIIPSDPIEVMGLKIAEAPPSPPAESRARGRRKKTA